MGLGSATRADEVTARPKLVAEETEIDLGLRDAVPSFEFVFHLKNLGTAPLKITDVNPTCGCTVARFDREIAAGGTGLVTAVLDATRYKGNAEIASHGACLVRHLAIKQREFALDRGDRVNRMAAPDALGPRLA